MFHAACSRFRRASFALVGAGPGPLGLARRFSRYSMIWLRNHAARPPWAWRDGNFLTFSWRQIVLPESLHLGQEHQRIVEHGDALALGRLG
jgi:hypothetical protein